MIQSEKRAPVALLGPLSDREQAVLRLMAERLSAQEMARRLQLSPTTVKWYTRQIYSKLGIQEGGQKRGLAVARARMLGLLEAERTPAGRLRYNLPVPTTPLVGRARELAAISALLANPQVRLLTLLGPGGMGKTRLALEVAWRLVEPEAFGLTMSLFPDGVYFTPLQSLDTAENIPWAVAEAVGYPFQSDGREPQRQLLDFFREKHLLLVLDNFEQVLEGAVLVSDILQAAPGVQALVTSREGLNLTAETMYSLEGLPFPKWKPSADVPDYDAAQLFVQGARRANASFELQSEDREALARICHLVQGMPLALLLAAAWVEVLSLPEIAEEITHSFDFLAAEMRDAPRRQWSIRAVFEPTWQRLSAQEQRVFMRMAVFRGGCTREAAQTVTGASLPTLQGLVNKAVLSRTPKGRYEIHELLRQYAHERLEAAREDEAVLEAYTAYYAAFIAARQEDLKGGDRQIPAFEETDADFENVRAAWEWAVERRCVTVLAQIEWSLWWYLNIRSRYSEGYALFHNALAVDEDLALSGRLMGRYSFFCGELGRHRERDEWGTQALDRTRQTGNKEDLAWALRQSAFAAATSFRDHERAQQMVDESLALYEELGDRSGLAGALQVKSCAAFMQGDTRSALSFSEAALAQARSIGDRYRVAVGLLNTGIAYSELLGEYDEALRRAEESLAVFRELNAPGGIALATASLGVQAQFRGDYDAARQRYEDALALAQEFGQPALAANNLLNGAYNLSLMNRPDEAAERLDECSRVLRDVEDKNAEASVPLVRAWLAYRGGDAGEALRWGREALDYARARELAEWESSHSTQIALFELRLGQLDAAREHLRAGLPGLLNRFHVMRALYTLAALAAATEQPGRATELAALVQRHRTTEYEFKVHATELLNELQAVLPPETYAEAVERGADLDPDDVVAAWLQENALHDST